MDLKSEESESSMQREGTEQRAKGIVKCQQAASSLKTKVRSQVIYHFFALAPLWPSLQAGSTKSGSLVTHLAFFIFHSCEVL